MSTITVDGSGVSRVYPSGQLETVKWSELYRVAIHTTSEGPFAEDFYWVLFGPNQTGCVVPQGLAGDAFIDALKEHLGELNWQALIEASCCAEDAWFLVWERAN